MFRIPVRNLATLFTLGVLTAFAVGLSGCGRTPDASLSCTGGPFGWYCHLRPGMSYLGLRLGLDKRAAFQDLCTGANAGYFYDPNSTFYPEDVRNGETDLASFGFRGPIKCSYWSTMKRSYAWSFRSKNGPCLLKRSELIITTFHANKLSYFEVGCVTMPIV